MKLWQNMQISPATQWVHHRNDSPVVHSRAIPSPIGSMVLLYMVTFCNIYHQYTPVMLAYIPAPWIRHGSDMGHHRTKWDRIVRGFQPLQAANCWRMVIKNNRLFALAVQKFNEENNPLRRPLSESAVPVVPKYFCGRTWFLLEGASDEVLKTRKEILMINCRVCYISTKIKT